MGRRALSETGDGQILRDYTLIFTVANNNDRAWFIPKFGQSL